MRQKNKKTVPVFPARPGLLALPGRKVFSHKNMHRNKTRAAVVRRAMKER